MGFWYTIYGNVHNLKCIVKQNYDTTNKDRESQPTCVCVHVIPSLRRIDKQTDVQV